MGGKQYRHQVAQDSSRQQQLKITEVVDVTSVKDYMLVCWLHWFPGDEAMEVPVVVVVVAVYVQH